MRGGLCVFASLALLSAGAGVNLLNNPAFERDASGFAADWCFRREALRPRTSFPEPGVVSLSVGADGISFRQGDIHLVPGRKYRLGAEVRTRGLGAKQARLVAYNYAWTKDAFEWLPPDTQGAWTNVKLTFEAPDSRDELYTFALHAASGRDGAQIDWRRPFLEPVSGVLDGEERAPSFDVAPTGLPAELPPKETAGRALNGLVRELAVAKVGEQPIGFSRTTGGWTWIAVEKAPANARIVLDGRDAGALRVSASGNLEVMCRLSAGRHSVAVTGARGSRARVHAVPTILLTSYPDSRSGGYEKIHGAFTREKIWPVVNTFSYGWSLGRIPAEEREALAASGREMFGHVCRWNRNTPGFDNRMEPSDHLAERFRKSSGLASAGFAGVTFDEISASALLEKLRMSGALRRLADAARPVWIWSSGVVYEENAVNADYLDAIATASGGAGRLILECYAQTQKDAVSAERYYDDFLDGAVRRLEGMRPGFVRATMVVNGGYTKPGRYLTDCHAGADVKRFWDMYYHRLATHPVFEGLAGVGLYAANNAEEEDLRWSLRLFRHYAIEGRTDSLADRLGFAYNPNHLANPDFAKGLDGWTAEPAEEGSLVATTVKGFRTQQVRKEPGTGGDQVVRFRRSAKGPNVLRQRLKGLVPGRLYSLRYVVADAAEVAAKKAAENPIAFQANVRGAEDVTASSPAARLGETDRRTGALCERTLVFRPSAADAELVFSDAVAGAPVGQDLIVNFVRIKPYYSSEEL